MVCYGITKFPPEISADRYSTGHEMHMFNKHDIVPTCAKQKDLGGFVLKLCLCE